MNRPILLAALALLACASPRYRTFKLDDFDLDWDTRSGVVSVTRPRRILGAGADPVIALKPAEGSDCFTGSLASNMAPLGKWRGEEFIQTKTSFWPLALCRDPDAPGDPTAFRLDLRDATGELHIFLFNARRVESDAFAAVTGKPGVRIRLPASPSPLHEHPQIAGALVALKLLSAGKGGSLSLEP